MKKFNLFILLGMAIFFSACSITKNVDVIDNNNIEPEPIEKVGTNNQYEHKLENFSIEYPKNWTLTENDYSFDVMIKTPHDDNIDEHVGISIQKLQKFLSTAEYYEETIFQLKDSLESFKEISSKDFNKWKLNGKQITYEHNVWEHKIKSQQTFLISTENTVYSINYTATKNTFDKYFEWAKLILDSFELNK